MKRNIRSFLLFLFAALCLVSGCGAQGGQPQARAQTDASLPPEERVERILSAMTPAEMENRKNFTDRTASFLPLIPLISNPPSSSVQNAHQRPVLFIQFPENPVIPVIDRPHRRIS